MDTTTKKTTKKAPKILTGKALFEHRMRLLDKWSKEPLFVERGRNIWNLKPYKD